jgi:hypothetical protein
MRGTDWFPAIVPNIAPPHLEDLSNPLAWTRDSILKTIAFGHNAENPT